jgi:hypothetical protein
VDGMVAPCDERKGIDERKEIDKRKRKEQGETRQK